MPVRHPYQRGDLVQVPFLSSGLQGQKVRPAVVLSTDDYEEWDELLVVAVTSQRPQ